MKIKISKFKAANFSARLNFEQRRKQFDAITAGNRVITPF